MALASGVLLGPYEILSAIGAGGMGEVYRARDTRLKRDVALKILPESFASDPERLARFQREAEVLASLSHPNIAGIYGVEEADGTRALVSCIATRSGIPCRTKRRTAAPCRAACARLVPVGRRPIPRSPPSAPTPLCERRRSAARA
jgi:protein kinase-like protein